MSDASTLSASALSAGGTSPSPRSAMVEMTCDARGWPISMMIATEIASRVACPSILPPVFRLAHSSITTRVCALMAWTICGKPVSAASRSHSPSSVIIFSSPVSREWSRSTPSSLVNAACEPSEATVAVTASKESKSGVIHAGIRPSSSSSAVSSSPSTRPARTFKSPTAPVVDSTTRRLGLSESVARAAIAAAQRTALATGAPTSLGRSAATRVNTIAAAPTASAGSSDAPAT